MDCFFCFIVIKIVELLSQTGYEGRAFILMDVPGQLEEVEQGRFGQTYLILKPECLIFVVYLLWESLAFMLFYIFTYIYNLHIYMISLNSGDSISETLRYA